MISYRKYFFSVGFKSFPIRNIFFPIGIETNPIENIFFPVGLKCFLVRNENVLVDLSFNVSQKK